MSGPALICPDVRVLPSDAGPALAGGAEVFAFATSPTRLTGTLARRSAEDAIGRATEQVTDRFGGTRIAGCPRELLGSHHGGPPRGAIVSSRRTAGTRTPRPSWPRRWPGSAAPTG